ncbi:MAG: hypothetical protein ACRDRP_07170 [Pseudonocardiaceae bacterium]
MTTADIVDITALAERVTRNAADRPRILVGIDGPGASTTSSSGQRCPPVHPSLSTPSGSVEVPLLPVDVEIPPLPVDEAVAAGEERDVGLLVARTLVGLLRHADGPVRVSMLKRAVLRKDPTFDEAEQGFRGFGELLRHLESQPVVELRRGSAQGDPEVTFPEDDSADGHAFRLFADVVGELPVSGAPPQLSGLKNQLRKRLPGFSEKCHGFNPSRNCGMSGGWAASRRFGVRHRVVLTPVSTGS